MKKLLILDKDGTLTTTKSGEKFVQHPNDQKIIPGMGRALIEAKNQDWRICVASNQGGIIAGYKTHLDTTAEFVCLQRLFPEIEMAVYCPDQGRMMTQINYKVSHIWTQDVRDWNLTLKKTGQKIEIENFRKPSAGMIQLLIASFESKIGEDRIVYIGDRPEDEQAALNAGVVFIWADVFNQDYRRFL